MLNPNISVNKVYKISENFVSLQDSWLSNLIESDGNTYIDFKLSNDYYPRVDLSQNLPLFTLQFVLDENSNQISRIVQTIFDGFS